MSANLTTPVEQIDRYGVRFREPFERLGLRRVVDFLSYFPRGYEDFTDRRTIATLEANGQIQSVIAKVRFVEQRSIRRGGTMVTVHIEDSTDRAKAVFFNQPWLRNKLFPGLRILCSGKPKRERGDWVFSAAKYQVIPEPMGSQEGDATDEEETPTIGILPVYGLTDGLPQWAIRRLQRLIVQEFASLVEDVFTEEYRQRHHLLPIHEALVAIHFPPDMETLAQARRRLIYYELLLLQLAVGRRRRQQEAMASATPVEWSPLIDQRIRRLFPAPFTDAQNEAVAQVTKDMGSPIPMGRLLQGDVGSGKTWVAVYAMLLAAAHKYQAVLMAPTEVLARQHDRTLHRLLSMSQVKHTLLTGGLRPAQKKEILRQIESGEISLIVGTHAILYDVKFANPVLMILDEQHRFGVRQRARLRNEQTTPHYLVMTATPIPRTLTMTLFGDLEVSTLKDSPPGRKKVHTYLVAEEDRGKWRDFVVRKLREGRQAYWIVPAVEDSAIYTGRSLDAILTELRETMPSDIRIGSLHGRMTSSEKTTVMDDFRHGELQILAATTVVEVGVDVPNATLMTIESADCFGLSQLHQLRGRIVRGAHPGYCGVFAKFETDEKDTTIAISNTSNSSITPPSTSKEKPQGRAAEVQRRIEAFVRCTDGFELAEVDFELRGPGDLVGTRQHGIPEMLIADLFRDRAVLEETQRDAAEILRDDPGLADPTHALLRRRMLAKYRTDFDLADTG